MVRKIYSKLNYNLGDNAKVTHIENYVNNSTELFDELDKNISWNKFKYDVGGREVISPRLMNIYHFNLNDDNDMPNLYNIKSRIEKITGVSFAYAVLNYYRDGNDYIGFHSDKEVNAGHIVVSVSIGATRRFVLKHKYRDDVKHVFMLKDGDVLILNEHAIKIMYRHSVPKMANVGPRINITFRQN